MVVEKTRIKVSRVKYGEKCPTRCRVRLGVQPRYCIWNFKLLLDDRNEKFVLNDVESLTVTTVRKHAPSSRDKLHFIAELRCCSLNPYPSILGTCHTEFQRISVDLAA